MSQAESFDPNGFTLSSAAVEHFKNSLSSKEADAGIRFSVEEASGCSGYNYAMDFVENHVAEDFTFNFEDLKVYIDPHSAVILDKTIIDYIKTLQNEGFVFNNSKSSPLSNISLTISQPPINSSFM